MTLYELCCANLAYVLEENLELLDYDTPRVIARGHAVKLIELGYGQCKVKMFNGSRIYIIK
jgi:hypothetical protein